MVDIAGLPVPADVQGCVQLSWIPNATEGVAWVETGDIGCLAFDGTLFLSGREGEIVTRGGATVSLAEVESAMVASGLVLDAMSYPIEQAMHGELFGAAVVWAGDADAESLRAYVRERLGSPAVPAVITGVTVIPRDHQGKLTRTPQPAVEPSASPADPVRADLRDIWAEVVGHSSFADADDFFGIGGDSLAAAMCNTLIEERLGVVLPLSMHYEATTLDQLAEAIRANAVRGSGAEGVL